MKGRLAGAAIAVTLLGVVTNCAKSNNDNREAKQQQTQSQPTAGIICDIDNDQNQKKSFEAVFREGLGKAMGNEIAANFDIPREKIKLSGCAPTDFVKGLGFSYGKDLLRHAKLAQSESNRTEQSSNATTANSAKFNELDERTKILEKKVEEVTNDQKSVYDASANQAPAQPVQQVPQGNQVPAQPVQQTSPVQTSAQEALQAQPQTIQVVPPPVVYGYPYCDVYGCYPYGPYYSYRPGWYGAGYGWRGGGYGRHGGYGGGHVGGYGGHGGGRR